MSEAMAFRDRMHTALVYFGLAEERVDRYDSYAEPAPADPAYADPYAVDRPRRSNVPRPRREEAYDEIFAEESAGGQQAAPVLRAMPDPGFGDVRVHLVLPKSFNDAQQMADRYKDGVPVILNLQGVETDLSRRLIDFASGLTYALDGGMQRIADKVFMLTPRNVELSAEQRAQLLEKGFFNQS
jgi:cell division inhibitor SepF